MFTFSICICSNRVNGNLALSRALGDFMFKRNSNKIPEEQIVTAYPDVVEREINEDWEFAVLACDGIWDVLRNEVKLATRRYAGDMDKFFETFFFVSLCINRPLLNSVGIG